LNDEHWLGRRVESTSVRSTRRSFHLVMRDGVKIAVDVHVPEGARRAPAILRQTRYLRSLDARLGALAAQFDLYARTRRVFLAAGYAWIDVDVRGTGASTGSWPCPWSPDEVRDGSEIVDWAIAQPWSNGRVGSLGISYDGTAAEMLTFNRHPAVRAVAPMFSLYDVYADVAFPGGIHLAWFTEGWHRYNAALDRDAWNEGIAHTIRLIGRAGAVVQGARGLERALAPIASRRSLWDAVMPRALGAAVRGVQPVDGDRDRTLVAEATRAHSGNVDLHAGALTLEYRDQVGMSAQLPNDSVDLFSPHAYRREAQESGAAFYSISGWRDGAYQHGAIKRHLSVRTTGSRLLIGPWVHSGKLRIVPFGLAEPSGFDFDAELLAFFGEHLGDGPALGGSRATYYTMVEDRWKHASEWPPPDNEERVYFLGDRRLLDAAPEPSSIPIREEGASGSGERSRWRSLLSLVPGDYPDRRERGERALVFESAPLKSELEVTGHPIVSLYVSWDDADDGHLFAYLEDAAEDGRVAYVTEGQLRAKFRDRSEPPCTSPVPLRSFTRASARPIARSEIALVEFDLLPISWLFVRGHRIRIAITGADRDHFAVLSPRTFRVHLGGAHASRIELPIARR
jgi:uncharacterized protein